MDIILNIIIPILLLGALGVFLRIQSYMEDPGRKEFNRRWFEAYEAHIRLCYEDGAATWRSQDLKKHFNRAAD